MGSINKNCKIINKKIKREKSMKIIYVVKIYFHTFNIHTSSYLKVFNLYKHTVRRSVVCLIMVVGLQGECGGR